MHVTSHEEQYRARVEAQRDRMFAHAATETSARLEALGWERIVLVAESQMSSRFREAMPPKMRERVIAEADLNLVGKEPTMIADAVEPLIEDAWRRRTQSLATVAYDRARSGSAATLGAQETLGALAEGRVAHLLIDPDHDFSAVADMIPPSIGGPAELIVIGSSGRAGVSAALLGSVAAELPLAAARTVVVIPRRAAERRSEHLTLS